MKNRFGLIAKKVGNSSFFSDNGNQIPVTIVKVEDCFVSGIKTIEKDGYSAVQLASIDKSNKVKKINKPQRKIFTSLDIKPKKILKEFRVDNDSLPKLGTCFNVNHFERIEQ